MYSDLPPCPSIIFLLNGSLILPLFRRCVERIKNPLNVFLRYTLSCIFDNNTAVFIFRIRSTSIVNVPPEVLALKEFWMMWDKAFPNCSLSAGGLWCHSYSFLRYEFGLFYTLCYSQDTVVQYFGYIHHTKFILYWMSKCNQFFNQGI